MSEPTVLLGVVFHLVVTFCVLDKELASNIYRLLNFVTLPRYFQDVMTKQKMGEKVLEKWGFSKLSKSPSKDHFQCSMSSSRRMLATFRMWQTVSSLFNDKVRDSKALLTADEMTSLSDSFLWTDFTNCTSGSCSEKSSLRYLL